MKRVYLLFFFLLFVAGHATADEWNGDDDDDDLSIDYEEVFGDELESDDCEQQIADCHAALDAEYENCNSDECFERIEEERLDCDDIC